VPCVLFVMRAWSDQGRWSGRLGRLGTRGERKAPFCLRSEQYCRGSNSQHHDGAGLSVNLRYLYQSKLLVVNNTLGKHWPSEGLLYNTVGHTVEPFLGASF